MIRIFADSTCDMPQELVEKYNVTVVPLFVVLGDRECLDGVDVTPDDIFKWSDENRTTPKTAAPAPYTVSEALKPVLEAGDEVIVFTISESMSNTANVFRLAAAELDAADRVTVIDSANLCVAISLMIIEAAEMIAAGKTRAEVAAGIEALKSKARASFIIDTLEYLRRGGRCNSVTALAGAVFNIHPRIDVVDGAMGAGRKYRGRMDMAIRHYADDLREELLRAQGKRVFVVHSGCDGAILDEMIEYVRDLGHFDEILTARAGGVISSHCGPGAFGIMFLAQ